MKKLIFICLFTMFFSIAKSENIIVFNYEDIQYEQAIQEKNKNILLILGADWCPSCNKLKNEISTLKLENYIICYVNVEERKDLAKKYKINKYPTSIVINNNEEKSRIVGYSKNSYQNWINKIK